MKIPFWLLIVFTTAEAPIITSITQFQTEDECKAAQKVVEAVKSPERQRFNVYQPRQIVICERAIK